MAIDEDKARLREESKERQRLISDDWKAVAAQYPHLIDDFVQFTQGLATTFRYWAEEQQMGEVPLDDHQVVACLQKARVCDTVRTYITGRIDSDVAQPIKKSK